MATKKTTAKKKAADTKKTATAKKIIAVVGARALREAAWSARS